MCQRRRRTFRSGTRGGDPARALSPLSSAFAVAFLLALAPAAPSSAEEAPSVASFDRAEISAAGKSVALLTVSEFGRYSIAVESKTGVSLQVVDRMAGAGEVSGTPGEQDGRIDLFLDRGSVRVLARGAALGRGTAKLTVRPFVERNVRIVPAVPVAPVVPAGPADAPTPENPATPQDDSPASNAPRLVEHKPITTDLGDLEQRSFWIEIPKRRSVVFEAAGRHLADLRLWKSGSWIESATPLVSTLEPERGRPLTLCQLAADLEPGLYLLTAYGGAGQPWSVADSGAGDRPLHLRWGIERRGVAARSAGRISELGFDRLVVPAAADYFRLELPSAAPASIEVAAWDFDDPLRALGGEPSQRADLTKESVPPVAELRRATVEGERWLLVTVRAAPGQSYVLERFRAAKRFPFAGGSVWLGSLHAGAAGDAIDATGVLVALPTDGKSKPRVVASSAIPLDSRTSWRRRFNLLEAATLHVEVKERGEYEVASSGLAAELRIEPFFVSPPDGYSPPPLRPSPLRVNLDPGLYLLTLQPAEAGIVELALRSTGLPSSGGTPAFAPARPMVQLGAQRLDRKVHHELWLNDQPGVETGGLLRSLPLDLSDPLTVALEPGRILELPAKIEASGSISALTDGGEPVELSVDGADWNSELAVTPGSLTLHVRSGADRTVVASVAFADPRLAAASPLPELSAESRARLPHFPELDDSEPRFLDLERRQAATFDVAAHDSGLYVVETSGLLATEGALRTRVLPELAAASENGVGRNAALRAYLREGVYQATIRARGASAGHLGVELRRAQLADGGELPMGIAARAEAGADEALAYTFEIASEGDYRLRSLGLHGALEGRLEDADGWPVDAPTSIGDLTLRLESGRYRWIVLPRAVPFRAVTRLEPVAAEPEAISGHGPHSLPLDRESAGLWLEPESGRSRTPDSWTFTLPAPAETRVSLSDEMQAELVRRTEQGREVVAFVPPGRGWIGPLEAGEYWVEAVSSRVNSRVRYRVAVRPTELVAGVERTLPTPIVATVSIGSTSIGGEDESIEIDSFGSTDVRARLFDEQGRRVAESDDRPGDWNFLIAEPLRPGRYRLEVVAVGAEAGETTVAVRARPHREEPAVALPAERTFQLGEDVVVVPLELPRAAELLAAAASATAAGDDGRRGSFGLALEEQLAIGWGTVATASDREPLVAVPLDPSSFRPRRLRLWSLDRRPLSVRLTGYAGSMPMASEGELAAGVRLEPLPGSISSLSLRAVRLDHAGCFALESESSEGLLQSLRAGAPFSAAPRTLVAPSPTLWLASRSGDPAPVVARRIVLDGTEPLSLVLPPGERVICDVAGGAPLVAEVTTLAGDPWVRFDDESRERIGTSTAFGVRRALAVSSDTKSRRRVELGHNERVPIEARLSITSTTSITSLGSGESPRSAQSDGAIELELGPRTSRQVTIPGGERALRLTLGRGGAAIVSSPVGGAAFWAPATDELFELAGGESVELLNPTAESVRARIEVAVSTAAGEQATTGNADLLVERFLDRATTLRAEIPASSSDDRRTLQVRGARAARLIGADGAVGAGLPLEIPRTGGSLILEAGPGLVAAWIERDARDLRALGFELASLAERLALPFRRELQGREQSFGVHFDAPVLLSIRGARPGAVGLTGETGNPRFELFPEATSFDALVPAGSHLISLRGLAGSDLGGDLEIRTLPLSPLGEGLGEPTLLAPGEARAYAFEVSRHGPVGVGVAAADRGVGTVVFALDGRELGRGVVQWLDLEPGRYALAVVASSDAAPGIVRPALVGVSPPGEGPPAEVVRAFLALERGSEPIATGVAGFEAAARYRSQPTEEAPDDESEMCVDDEGDPCWEGDEGEGEIE